VQSNHHNSQSYTDLDIPSKSQLSHEKKDSPFNQEFEYARNFEKRQTQSKRVVQSVQKSQRCRFIMKQITRGLVDACDCGKGLTRGGRHAVSNYSIGITLAEIKLMGADGSYAVIVESPFEVFALSNYL
jgi:hypothetical protein